jgi:hypothetical protein
MTPGNFHITRLLAAALLAMLPVAGLYARVDVTLHEPPPGQLDVEQLWWVDIDNLDTATYQGVWLHGEVREARRGLVYRANSNKFNLPPGLKRIRLRDITLRDQWHAPGYEVFLLRTGTVPEGDYTYWVTLEPDLGGDTNRTTVRQPDPPRLISPRDGTKLTREQKYPLFTWVGPPERGVTYELRIVEVLPGQTKEEAMRENQAWFEQGGIADPRFRYPPSGKGFDTSKTYAWQVIGLSGEGTIPVASEIWEFRPVQIPFTPPVSVKSVTLAKTGTYFKVNLQVMIWRDITDLEIKVWNRRFQCVLPNNQGAENYLEATGDGWGSLYLERNPQHREANSVYTASFYAVPILFHEPGWDEWSLDQYRICDSVEISCREGKRDWLLRPDLDKNPPGNALVSAVGEADFLIVTCPDRLFYYYDRAKVSHELLPTMGYLAMKKNGVLGFISAGASIYGWEDKWFETTAYWLRADLRPSGSWGEKLCPGWGTMMAPPMISGASTHDVLIVGEHYIVPSGDIQGLYIKPISVSMDPVTEVLDSDFLLADCDWDDIPELVVGRILGTTAGELTRSLRTALQPQPQPTSACLISGTDPENPAVQRSFEATVENVAKYLKSPGFEVSPVFLGETVDPTRMPIYFGGSPPVPPALLEELPGKDVIGFIGHGHEGEWVGALRAEQVHDLGASCTAPLVVAFACLAGSQRGYSSIASEFATKPGTAGYVGSTSVQFLVDMDEIFWTRCGMWRWNLARTLFHCKWSCTLKGGDYNNLWAWGYNFYGSPR